MTLVQALVLGLVQGATEFIPISSSAHLVLVPWLLSWDAAPLAFDTTVHWGTLVAVLAVFWRDIWALVVAGWNSLLAALGTKRTYDHTQARVAWALVLATLPAVFAGFFLESYFEGLFAEPVGVAWQLLVTAAILIVSERLHQRDRSLSDIGWLDALVIGLAQAVAIVPGISRSGATIAAGLARGVRREAAARFSFLLSVPVILGAGLFQLFDLTATGELGDLAGAMIVGFVVAAVSGYLCIRWLLRYLSHRSMNVFAAYCVLFGIFNLVVALLRR